MARKPTFSNGDILEGRFLVVKTLFGGMGEIIICEDNKEEKLVVLKTYFDQYLHNEKTIDDFKKEAEAWIKLGTITPNIKNAFFLGLKEIIQISNKPYLLMEYCSGGNLQDKILEGSLKFETIVLYATQIIMGLVDIHNHEMVHRDLKPSNILFSDDSYIKITDLGIVKFMEHVKFPLSQETKGFIGTPPYASPEQYLGNGVDFRTDIWSFGVLLHEMLTGELPFQSQHEIFEAMPRNLVRLGKKAGDRIFSITLKCLEKDKNKRYQRFSELAKDWDNVICFSGNFSNQNQLEGNSKIFIHDEMIETSWNLAFFPERRSGYDVVWDQQYLMNFSRAEKYYQLEDYISAIAACDKSLGNIDDENAPIAQLFQNKLANSFTQQQKTLITSNNKSLEVLVIPPRFAVVKVLELKMKALINLLGGNSGNQYINQLYDLSERIIQSGIQDRDLIVMCAEGYVAAGHFKLAESLLWDLLKLFPDDLRIVQTLIIALTNQENIEGLKRLANYIFPMYQNKMDAKSLYIQTRLACAIQDWTRAESFAKSGLKDQPGNLLLLYLLCVTLVNRGNLEEAYSYFQIMQKIAPHDQITETVNGFFK